MATTNLPAIQHPLSRMNDPAINLNVRGSSRAASRQSLTFGQEFERSGLNALRPVTADQVPWRLTKAGSKGGSRSPREAAVIAGLGEIPEGVQVRRAEDSNKTRIPIFGSRADILASRAESRLSRINSAASSLYGPEKISVDELEYLLREKMKTDYFAIRRAFREFDPEGRGTVNRESLAKILQNYLSKPVSLSQFNKLMVRLHLDHKKMIAFDEFYAAFRPPKKENEGPAWLELQKPELKTMSASQVHAQLKEKIKRRFLEVADLIPQINPGGSGRLLKPEFRNVLNKMSFYMEDEEFEKLWLKYDTENYGTIRAERLMNKLGFSMKETESRDEPRSPRKLEAERKLSLDIERWLRRKFRDAFSEMKHAFMEMDLDRTGRVSREQFRRVLDDFDLHLNTDKQVDDFLARCSVSSDNGSIPYKEFLRRFQDRSDQGMPHKILANPLHRYHHSDAGSHFSTTSAVEAKLMDVFQKDFLALLGTFHNIDRRDTGLLTQQQFRAAIEGRFELEMSDEDFERFLKMVPIDNEGMVKYVEFMSQFDTTDNSSLFDKSSFSDRKEPLPPLPEADSPPLSPRKRVRPIKTVDSFDSQDGRSVVELRALIKRALQENYPAFEEAFHELDEFNTKRMTQGMMGRLLKRFGVELSRNEIRRLWDTFITDQRGYLEYWQFVRHFGYSLESAAFPNSKISPPKRGDKDFMMRSNKLNSALDMLYDQLRSMVDHNWERLLDEFKRLDYDNSGKITRANFKAVLQDLCIELTDYEGELLCNKLDPNKEGSINFVKFLEPVAKRRGAFRHGYNMQAVMTHPVTEPPSRSQPKESILAAKLRQELSGEWKNLRRAFKNVDLKNDGCVSVRDFRCVLRQANVGLDDEEVYHLLTELDESNEGRVKYALFLDKIK